MSRKQFKDYTLKELDALMDKKWAKLCAKHDRYGMGWLEDMHNLLDWYDSKKQLITKK